MRRFFSRLTPTLLFALISLELINFLDSSGKKDDRLGNNIAPDNSKEKAPFDGALQPIAVNERGDISSQRLPQNDSPTAQDLDNSNSPAISTSSLTNSSTQNISSTSKTSSKSGNQDSKTNTEQKSTTNEPKIPNVNSILTIKGDPISYRYGTLQVEIKVDNKKIVEISKLQAPGGANSQFTNYAFPILIAQALNGQTAYIDGASGATYTSQAFVDSLQSAINRIP